MNLCLRICNRENKFVWPTCSTNYQLVNEVECTIHVDLPATNAEHWRHSLHPSLWCCSERCQRVTISFGLSLSWFISLSCHCWEASAPTAEPQPACFFLSSSILFCWNSFAFYPKVALNSLRIPNSPPLEAIHLHLPPRCWGCGQAWLLLLSWFMHACQELSAEPHPPASQGSLRTEWFQCVRLFASVCHDVSV